MNYDISTQVLTRCKTDATYRRAAEVAARFCERNKDYFAPRFTADSLVEHSGFKFSAAYTSNTITLFQCPDWINWNYIHIDDDTRRILV